MQRLQRPLALLLALLLLVGQPLAALHLLSHGHLPQAPVALAADHQAASHTAAGHPTDAGAPGETLCHVCLVLAGLAAAAPALAWAWRARQAAASAPRAAKAALRRPGAALPYQARAPPAALH